MSDTYTATEAARLLDVSDRRVRQLAATGTLTVAATNPLRLDALSVLAERDKRRTEPPRTRTAATATRTAMPAAALDAEQLRQLVAAIVADLLPRMIEAQRRTEDSLRDELAAARAETAQLRSELDSVRRQSTSTGQQPIDQASRPAARTVPRPAQRPRTLLQRLLGP